MPRRGSLVHLASRIKLHRLMSPNNCEKGLGLLVFRLRENLAWQFGVECSYWNRVKTDLHMTRSKLRLHGVQNDNGR